MKKALIETSTGRLCDIVLPGAEFPVAPGLQWMDAPDDVAHDTHVFDGATVVAKPGPSLDAIKAARRAAVNIARDAACVADVTVNGKAWQADARSQQMLASAIALAGAGLPLPASWRARDNSNMPVTGLADLLAIAGAMAAQTQAAYEKSWALKAQIDAATTAAEVEAVQW